MAVRFQRLSTPPLESVAAAALAAAPVVALGFADGGFYPRPWGWAALGLSLIIVAVLVLRREVCISRRALLLLGLLAVLGIWIFASFLWTRSASLSVFELQRLLVYMTGVGAAALFARKDAARALGVGVFLGTGILTSWGLVLYLLHREHTPDVFQGALLHRPLGYANAMAIASVMALLLGLGIAADYSSRRVRVAAAVALVPLSSALALTGGRAAWGALLVGTGFALVVTPNWARTLILWLWVLAVPAAGVVLLTVIDPTNSRIVGVDADQLGDQVLVAVVALTALAVVPALIATGSSAVSVRLRVPRRAWIAVTSVALVAVLIVGVTRFSGLGGDRPIFWRVAAAEFEESPLLGSGAGTYAQVWLERRPVNSTVRDAHSIVLETLSELGAVGLVLVLLLLGAPLVWGVRARDRPFVPAVTGAFAAYVVHASVDWDWEMPAITLAALFCAVMLGVTADRDERPVALGAATRGSALALGSLAAAAALAGFVGASALEDASRSLARRDPAAAERAARRAERWQPWAIEPLLARGQAFVLLGDRSGARALFARAAEHEPNDYRAWLALAAVSDGDAAQAAVSRARELNPRAVRRS
jgi:O-antigen ligase